MREIQASDAAAQFAELLDAVERGESIIIARQGRRVARIVPDPERRQQDAKEAIENIKSLGREIRETHGPMTIDEILSLRHEGHKY